jgi:hypothetical protein
LRSRLLENLLAKSVPVYTQRNLGIELCARANVPARPGHVTLCTCTQAGSERSQHLEDARATSTLSCAHSNVLVAGSVRSTSSPAGRMPHKVGANVALFCALAPLASADSAPMAHSWEALVLRPSALAWTATSSTYTWPRAHPTRRRLRCPVLRRHYRLCAGAAEQFPGL